MYMSFCILYRVFSTGTCGEFYVHEFQGPPHPMSLPPIEYTGREDIRGGVYLPSQLEHNAVNFSYRTSPPPSAVNLKGPKHDQVESGFFYTNQTRVVF
jgi:hypothetical protein